MEGKLAKNGLAPNYLLVFTKPRPDSFCLLQYYTFEFYIFPQF